MSVSSTGPFNTVDDTVDDSIYSLQATRKYLAGILEGKSVEQIRDSKAVKGTIRTLNDTINAVSQRVDGYIRREETGESSGSRLKELKNEFLEACTAFDDLRSINIRVLPKRAYLRRLLAFITGTPSVVVETAVNTRRVKEQLDQNIVAAFANAKPGSASDPEEVEGGKQTTLFGKKVTITSEGLTIEGSDKVFESWVGVKENLQMSLAQATEQCKQAAGEMSDDGLKEAVKVSGRPCYRFATYNPGGFLGIGSGAPSGKAGEIHIASQDGEIKKYDVTFGDDKFHCSVEGSDLTSHTLEGLGTAIEGVALRPASLESLQPVVAVARGKCGQARQLLESEELILPQELQPGPMRAVLKRAASILVSQEDAALMPMRAGLKGNEVSFLVVKSGDNYQLRVVGQTSDYRYPLDISSQPGKICITIDRNQQELVSDVSEKRARDLKGDVARVLHLEEGNVRAPSTWYAAHRGVAGHQSDILSRQARINTRSDFGKIVNKLGKSAVGAYCLLQPTRNGFTIVKCTSLRNQGPQYTETSVAFDGVRLVADGASYESVQALLSEKFADAVSPDELREQEEIRDRKCGEFNQFCSSDPLEVDQAQECRTLFSPEGLWWVNTFSENGTTTLQKISSSGRSEQIPITMVNEGGVWKVEIGSEKYDSMEALFESQNLQREQQLDTHLSRYEAHKKLEKNFCEAHTGGVWGWGATRHYYGEISGERAEQLLQRQDTPVLFKEREQYKAAYKDSDGGVQIKDIILNTDSLNDPYYGVFEGGRDGGFDTVEVLIECLERAGEPEYSSDEEEETPPAAKEASVTPPRQQHAPPPVREASVIPPLQSPPIVEETAAADEAPKWVRGVKLGEVTASQIKGRLKKLVTTLEEMDTKSLCDCEIDRNSVLYTDERKFCAWVRALAGTRPSGVTHDQLVELTAELPDEEKKYLRVVARNILSGGKRAEVLEAIGG